MTESLGFNQLVFSRVNQWFEKYWSVMGCTLNYVQLSSNRKSFYNEFISCLVAVNNNHRQRALGLICFGENSEN